LVIITFLNFFLKAFPLKGGKKLFYLSLIPCGKFGGEKTFLVGNFTFVGNKGEGFFSQGFNPNLGFLKGHPRGANHPLRVVSLNNPTRQGKRPLFPLWGDF